MCLVSHWSKGGGKETHLTETPVEAGQHGTWVLLSIHSVLTLVSCLIQGAATPSLPLHQHTHSPILARVGAAGTGSNWLIASRP